MKRLLVALVALAAAPAMAQDDPNRVVTQAEWAVMLGRVLGMNPDPRDPAGSVIRLLEQQPKVVLNAPDFSKRSEHLMETQFISPEGSLVESWIEEQSLAGTLFYDLVLTRPGLSMISTSARGGAQVWTIGTNPSRLIMPGEAKAEHRIGPLDLPAGKQTVTVSLTQGSAIEGFVLSGPFGSPIQPRSGWNAVETLTFGAKAVTVIRTLAMENQLPDEPKQSFEMLLSGTDGVPDAAGWTEFAFYVPQGGVYALSIQVRGPVPQHALIDGLYAGIQAPQLRPLSDVGAPSSEPTLVGVGELAKGRHKIALQVVPGSELDAVIIRKKVGQQQNYLNLLRELEISADVLGTPSVSDPVTLKQAEENIRVIRNILERDSVEVAATEDGETPPPWAVAPRVLPEPPIVTGVGEPR